MEVCDGVRSSEVRSRLSSPSSAPFSARPTLPHLFLSSFLYHNRDEANEWALKKIEEEDELSDDDDSD